ncbi:beta-propeller domain-containing protein [Micromonospora sp. 4G57]|uniref:Beta-propeller domain-containing protein n=1 Tax=Micromonospora sicca TaxID=2202420 RepID=A0ABU5JAB8_9ACTN|nr:MULTISPECIES: beta-propeller domain-containing protein [unclassified Micromonospora]MDZ5444125.1 beta-propeller domain-containing protein [Micromonospora sp. 4G57]MDZ5489521.1 beta-propeller domain-containing protein [Micromonospora sp. 4G53]
MTAYATTGTLLALSLLAGSAVAPRAATPDPTPPAAAPRLVGYDSCAEALAGLRAAAGAAVGPWGFGAGWRTGVADDVAMPAGAAARPQSALPPGAGAKAGSAAPEHSTTNSHEPGADEPDLVKTDGRRIVVVSQGMLRVVDAASRVVTGRLDLSAGESGRRWWPESSLLLHGDRALVLVRPAPEVVAATDRPLDPDRPADPDRPTSPDRPEGPEGPEGPRLLLVDLAGRPTVVGTYRIDGSLLDARQTGATARVVVRSQPRLSFPYDERRSDAERTTVNRAVIARAGLDAWLPRYEWTAGGERHSGRVGCDRLSRPATTSGTALLTVLSFDLATGRLGDGDPVTVASDADTVYGTADSLYLAGAGGAGWRPGWGGMRRPGPERTDIYRFDTADPGRPRYAAAGSVPGTLLNQYALSEWQGHLRVATTRAGSAAGTESAVHVLARRGDRLTETGRVDGLGRGERIYSVRFLGGTGYVVTFRQTDPLYALDLTDPAAPRLTGELKINGWSAYLHPVPGDRLLGVGQEADDRGRAQGLQVSLFDVHDPARPARLARHHVPGGGSVAEFDPHAFLFDPTTGLVALPLNTGGVRLLTVTDTGIADVGTVTLPQGGAASRSLLIDGRLWAVSDTGLAVVDPATARGLAWLPWT